MTKKTALVILANGVEELEAIAPIDCLRRANIHTTIASAGPERSTEGRNGIHLTADTTLDECLLSNYDLVVIPGGPGHIVLLEDNRVLEILRNQDAAGRLIGSICAGPVVLQRAGVLEGRAYTAFPGTEKVLPERDPTRKVVRDGHIITSQGAGTAILFGLALVDALCGESVRAEIAASICA